MRRIYVKTWSVCLLRPSSELIWLSCHVWFIWGAERRNVCVIFVRHREMICHFVASATICVIESLSKWLASNIGTHWRYITFHQLRFRELTEHQHISIITARIWFKNLRITARHSCGLDRSNNKIFYQIDSVIGESQPTNSAAKGAASV